MFSRISRRDRVGEKKRLEFFIYFFFSPSQWCVRVSASKFCSPRCSGSRDTTLGSFLRFMAGPARMCPWSVRARVSVTCVCARVCSFVIFWEREASHPLRPIFKTRLLHNRHYTGFQTPTSFRRRFGRYSVFATSWLWSNRPSEIGVGGCDDSISAFIF